MAFLAARTLAPSMKSGFFAIAPPVFLVCWIRTGDLLNEMVAHIYQPRATSVKNIFRDRPFAFECGPRRKFLALSRLRRINW